MVSQTHMIAKVQAPVDALISHYVAATAMSRVVDLFYWAERWAAGCLLKFLMSLLAWRCVFVAARHCAQSCCIASTGRAGIR